MLTCVTASSFTARTWRCRLIACPFKVFMYAIDIRQVPVIPCCNLLPCRDTKDKQHKTKSVVREQSRTNSSDTSKYILSSSISSYLTATMSSPQYTIVEPHPSVKPSQQYITTGRGGAGNIVKTSPNITRGSDASGPASRASNASLHTPRRSYLGGRGGAGNYTSDAPRMFSFDEELAQQMKQAKHIAPVYHVGRGGAGNLHRSSASSDAQQLLARRDSNNSSASGSSAESGADIATRNLKKGLKKLAGVF